jgi:hypothetical protein
VRGPLSQPTRRRLALSIAVMVLVAGAFYTGHAWHIGLQKNDSRSAGGPLTLARPGTLAPPAGGTSLELRDGATHTTGLGELHNPSDDAVRIDGVRVIDGSAGITVIGVMVFPRHQDAVDLANYNSTRRSKDLMSTTNRTARITRSIYQLALPLVHHQRVAITASQNIRQTTNAASSGLERVSARQRSVAASKKLADTRW